jgi:hypothetical protein
MAKAGWWWSSAPEEGWEGFAETHEEAVKQINEARYSFGDGEPMEIHLRPGLDVDDELTPITFTGPGEIIVLKS